MNLYQSPYEPELARTRAAKEFSRVGFALLALNLVFAFAAYAMQFAFLFIYNGDMDALASAWWINWILSLVPLYAMATPVMVLVLYPLPKAPCNTSCSDRGVVRDKTPFTVREFFVLLIIALGCMYIGSIIGSALMSLLSEFTGHDYQSNLDSIVSESPMWMTFVGTVICAPLGEEFLFRKLIIDRTRRFGDLISILVSAVTFALFHGNFFQFFYAFFIGLILAYIYTREGKLYWCVAMHAAVNFFGSILMPWLASYVPTEMPEATEDSSALLTYLSENALGLLISLVTTVLVYGLMIAAVVLVITLARRIQLGRGSYRLGISEGIMAAFLNPGMILAIAIMTVTLLGNLVLPLLTVG